MALWGCAWRELDVDRQCMLETLCYVGWTFSSSARLSEMKFPNRVESLLRNRNLQANGQLSHRIVKPRYRIQS